MMLDLVGLPKNANGFRTTHTCELCGFEPKTKNKYREKQDHLVMKHFKDRIDKIFPHCRPYSCPNTECDFTGKDKQALLRHYTGKHGVLELYLREALAEKGIQYQLSDSAKRKSQGHCEPVRKPKEPRLTVSPPSTILPPASPTGAPTSVISTPLSLGVDLASTAATTCSSYQHRSSPTITTSSSPPAICLMDTATGTTTLLPDNSLLLADSQISMVDSPESDSAIMADTTTTPLGDFPEITYSGSLTRLPTVPTDKLPSMSTVLNSRRCDVDALLASFQPLDGQLVLSVPNGGGHNSFNQQLQNHHHLPPLNHHTHSHNPDTSSPIELDSHVVSSTTPDFYLPLVADEPSKVVLNDNIMWGGGNLGLNSLGNGGGGLCGGGGGVGDSLHTGYLDSPEAGFVNLSDIDFDYLYSSGEVEGTTVLPPPPPPPHHHSQQQGQQQQIGISNAERQLSFSML